MISTEVRFWAGHVGTRVSMNVLLPERGPGPWATLYLLHGLGDDHTIWARMTRLEAYAWNLPLAIVMPQGFRGFYTRNEDGPDYVRYFVEDVIGTAERIFPLRAERAARAIGGLSMGGYGALRVGLAHPELFGSIHSHSGALLYGTIGRRAESVLSVEEYERIFGRGRGGSGGAAGTPAGTHHDLLHLAQRARQESSNVSMPRLLVDCGVDDFLIEQNRAFHAAMSQLDVAMTYREHAGAHNWDYWDLHVREALTFHAEAMGLEPLAVTAKLD